MVMCAIYLMGSIGCAKEYHVSVNDSDKQLDLLENHMIETQYAFFEIDDKGFITSIIAKQSKKEYSPAGHPSPLMSLHEGGKLIAPQSASFDTSGQTVSLNYPNDVIAVVKIEAQEKYLRLQLESLTPRGNVDAIVWGPLNTTVKGLLGDIIGVVRDPKQNWAIGMMGLDDNTITGLPVDGDCYNMHYYIHSPDSEKHPIPPEYKEGQKFNIGGDGHNDVAFYSKPEHYFQIATGNAIEIKPEFGTSIAYNARDRRKPRTVFYSLLSMMENYKAKHQQVDPVDVDFIGSAIAIYACPDDKGLNTIESIVLAEGLPHPEIDGKWIKDPSSFRPDIAWTGPQTKLIEYANVLGLKAVQDEGIGEYYPNPANRFAGKKVTVDGKIMSIREFTDMTNAHGIAYGLHTLCAFLQPHTSYVTPVPHPNLQAVCRTKLAEPVSETDTSITVADPVFLAEQGTWHNRNKVNVIRIGTELMTYNSLSKKAPWVLNGVKRGQYKTSVSAHSAGDELVKLQMNCYQGFVPDMKLTLEIADYYAQLMYDGGMEYIDFDGLESFVYQNHGYYAMRIFFRRLYDTYAELSGGKVPKVMASCVFPGGWHYQTVCNIGGGNRMFDPINNKWGIQGKDFFYGWGNNYFPPTFGIQQFNNAWTLYDIQNLQAKSIGFDATYMLGLSENVENCPEKDALFKAFRTWEDARIANVFTKAHKQKLKDLDYKFHLEQTGEKAFTLYPVKEIRKSVTSGDQVINVTNPYSDQPLQAAIRIHHGTAEGVVVTLSDGTQIKTGNVLSDGEYIIINGDQAHLANKHRQKKADLELSRPAVLPAGECQFRMTTSPGINWSLTVWTLGEAENVG